MTIVVLLSTISQLSGYHNPIMTSAVIRGYVTEKKKVSQAGLVVLPKHPVSATNITMASRRSRILSMDMDNFASSFRLGITHLLRLRQKDVKLYTGPDLPFGKLGPNISNKLVWLKFVLP